MAGQAIDWKMNLFQKIIVFLQSGSTKLTYRCIYRQTPELCLFNSLISVKSVSVLKPL